MRRVVLILALTAVAAAQSTPDRGYSVYLWVSDGAPPALLEPDRLRGLGITALNAEGASDGALAAKRGLPFYLDHAVPKGFLHVRPTDFDAEREAWRRDPKPDRLVRRPCLRDPAALAEAIRALRKTRAAYGDARPDFVSLTDEPSTTRSISPMDWCQDATCRAALGPWLIRKWGSEERARAAWGPHWPAGGAPAIVLTEDARRALFHDVGDWHTLVAWNDTRAFADTAFVDAVAALTTEGRALFPGTDVGLNGVDMFAVFGGFDWERLAPSLGCIELYDWGAARDVAASFLNARTRILHTVTPGEVDAFSLAHELWHYFLRGDRGVVLFDSQRFFTAAERPAPTPLMSATAPLLALLASPQLAAWRRAVPLPAQVAILHSQSSIRAQWLLDTKADGSTWFNRLASWEHEHGSIARSLESWTTLLRDLGISYRFIGSADLDAESVTATSGALLLPHVLALSDGDARAITAFAEHHLVIADCQLGAFTAQLEPRATPALDSLFGIAHPPRRTVDDLCPPTPSVTNEWPYYLAAEARVTAVGGAATRVLNGVPVFVSRGAMRSHALYLNLAMTDYCDDRMSHPARAAALRAWIREHLLSSQVRPRIEVTPLPDEPPWPITTQLRRDGTDLLVAIEVDVRSGSRAIDWAPVRARPSVRVHVEFPGTFEVSDVLEKDQALGTRNAVDVSVSVDRPRILRLRR